MHSVVVDVVLYFFFARFLTLYKIYTRAYASRGGAISFGRSRTMPINDDDMYLEAITLTDKENMNTNRLKHAATTSALLAGKCAVIVLLMVVGVMMDKLASNRLVFVIDSLILYRYQVFPWRHTCRWSLMSLCLTGY